MPLGITPARGDWEYRRSLITTLAAGQFQKGDGVALGFGRTASLYTASNMTLLFGIATHDSLDSLPANYATIAIPTPGCTAYVDVWGASMVASELSFGECGSLVSYGGRTSSFSKLAASVWSRLLMIVGPVSSADSRIECAFVQNNMLLYSTSSVSLLA